VVDKLDRLGTVHGDLGLALFKVAKAEEAQGGVLAGYTGTLRQSGALVGDEKRAAAALVRLGKMMARVTGRTVQELAPLHDYLGFMPVGCGSGVGAALGAASLHVRRAAVLARPR
jgi:hypothetical protein